MMMALSKLIFCHGIRGCPTRIRKWGGSEDGRCHSVPRKGEEF